jgi:hypothetical protein
VAEVAEPKRRPTRRDLLMLCALASALLLPNLGGPRLWADEGDTAVFARTILARGLPYAWDGRTFTESDGGARLNDDLLMVGTPWLPYYVTAAAFALLGESAWAARLPFALAGVASVALLYLLVLQLTEDRRAAVAAALLLLGSVQFLLFARQCRHYSLNALLTLAALIGFVRLHRRPRDPTFAIASVLLYHAHPLPAGAVLASTAGLCAIHPSFRAVRRAFCAWLPAILLLTLPWIWVAWRGWDENSTLLTGTREIPWRLAQLGLEWNETLPVLGWLLLAAAASAKLRAGDGAFLALALGTIGAFGLLLAVSQSALELLAYGLRYAVGVIPLAAGVTGVLAARASGSSLAGLAALVVLFTATHLPGASLPFALLSGTADPPPASIGLHRPKGTLGPWLRLEWIGYLRELRETDPGSVSRIADFLTRNASADDVVVTNYEWEPLYFHTNLPQGRKILPEHGIARAARAKGLPDYVFEVEGARWVVWRPPWEGSLGLRFGDVRSELERSGKRLVPVATPPETLWENRPEIHYHRFPGLGYLYPGDMLRWGYGRTGPARVFRVETGAPLREEPQP